MTFVKCTRPSSYDLLRYTRLNYYCGSITIIIITIIIYYYYIIIIIIVIIIFI